MIFRVSQLNENHWNFVTKEITIYCNRVPPEVPYSSSDRWTDGLNLPNSVDNVGESIDRIGGRKVFQGIKSFV